MYPLNKCRFVAASIEIATLKKIHFTDGIVRFNRTI